MWRKISVPDTHLLTLYLHYKSSINPIFIFSINPIKNADVIVDVKFGHHTYHVYARFRPYLTEFLEWSSKHFELVIFTASQQVYADKIVNMIDHKGLIT